MAGVLHVLVLVFGFQASSACDEQFVVPDFSGDGCIDYRKGNCDISQSSSPFHTPCSRYLHSNLIVPKAIASLPAGPFVIDDAYPMPYFVTAPCKKVNKEDTNCTSFNSGDSAGAPAYAAAQASKTSSVCYALGHLSDLQSAQPITSANNTHAGIEIE